MADISSSSRFVREACNGRGRRLMLLSAIGAGAGLLGCLSVPLVHADGSPASTDPNTAAAEEYLYNFGSLTTPNQYEGLATAYGELGIMQNDAYNAFAQLLGPEFTLDSQLITDVASIGQLIEGGIQDGTSIASVVISASKPAAAIPPGDLPPGNGASTPTDLPTTDIDVATDTTASQYVTGIDNEAAIVTQSLQNINSSILESNVATAYGVNDLDEADVTADLVSFQKEVNAAINLFPSVAAYENNSGLDYDLKELLTSELNLNTWAINLDEQVTNGSATGLAEVNADLLTQATGEYDYAQDILAFYAFVDNFG